MNVIDLSNVDLSLYLHQDEKRKIVPAFLLATMVKGYFNGEGRTEGPLLPWSKTHQNIRLRPAELSIWAGVNGHGKSMVLNQVMLSAMEQGQKVCIASFEMQLRMTMARMTRQAIGVAHPSDEYIERFHEWTDDKLWLYDEMKTVKTQVLLGLLHYCRNELGIQHFVIDSLMKCGIGEDDYNRQKWFINELCTIAKSTGIHIHLVAHTRKKETEKTVMDKFDIKGSGTITDLADNVFTVWRNKKKEDDQRQPAPNPEIQKKPEAIVNCDKQRHGEWEGKIGLWFEPASLQFHGNDYGHATCLFDRQSQGHD